MARINVFKQQASAIWSICLLSIIKVGHTAQKDKTATENSNITNTIYPDHRHTVVSVTSCFSRSAPNLTPCIFLTPPSNFFTQKFAQLITSGMSRKCNIFLTSYTFTSLSFFSFLFFLSSPTTQELKQSERLQHRSMQPINRNYCEMPYDLWRHIRRQGG